MSKDFILTTDELFGSYCYIEQKRYGVPNEKFLYKIIGKFTSNAWSNVPVDANDKEPHIFNHSEEVVNVVCCGVCEDKIERYKLSDVEIISNKDQQLADLEAKLAEKDKAIENWQTMYESVVQTCHNDKEEIERLNKQLETQENTITNLVEDNRASQEWYKKQLEEKEKENELMAKTLKLTKFVEKEVNQDKISFTIQQLEKVKEEIDRRPLTVRNCGYGEFEEILLDDVYDVIDNQINGLKGEK